MRCSFFNISLAALFLSACGGPPAQIGDTAQIGHRHHNNSNRHQIESNWGQAATTGTTQSEDLFEDRQQLQQVEDRQRGQAEVLEHLRFALADVDPGVRVEAVAQLAGFTGESIGDLLSYAYIDPHTSVRMEVVDAMGDIGGDRALSLLSIALSDDRNEVREAAVEACSVIGGDAAAMILSTALADEDADIREEALYALHEIGGSVAYGLLQQALSDDDEDLRQVAGALLRITLNAELQ